MLDISEVLVWLGGGGVLSIELPPGWLWSFCCGTFCSMASMSKGLLVSGALSSLSWLFVGVRSLDFHLLMFFMEALRLLSSVVLIFSPYIAHALLLSLMSFKLRSAADIKS